MTPEQFVAKYSKIQLKETAVSQSHFNDVCALVGHAPPPSRRISFPACSRTGRAQTGKLPAGRKLESLRYGGRKLEEAGYITVDKAFADRIPRTLIRLTADGRIAIQTYRENMRQVVEELLGNE